MLATKRERRLPLLLKLARVNPRAADPWRAAPTLAAAVAAVQETASRLSAARDAAPEA